MLRYKISNGNGCYVDSYDRVRPHDAREFARELALSVLVAARRTTGDIKRVLLSPRVEILNFHYVFRDEEQRLRELLRYLSQCSRFISYSEAVERIQSGRIDAPYVAFTIDDGLKNGVRAAAILAEFGVTACFFLCPAMIGVSDYEKIKEFCLRRLYIPPVEFMTWEDVERLKRLGHEIGAHTMTHARLSELTMSEVENEIGRSRAVLEQYLGEAKHFAWPFGTFESMTPEAVRTVFASGFRSCASAERGSHAAGPPRRAEQTCIRRDHTVAKWPLSHVLYFMSNSSHMASESSRDWPDGWRITNNG